MTTPAETDMTKILDLIERARFDLQKGWPAAAYDALARAMRLLEEKLSD